MTVFCGVDIAKELHYAAIMDNDGVVSNPFAFENNNNGFELLLSHLSSFDKDDIVIGYESTAHYQDNLAFFLQRRGYKTSLINPLITSPFRKVNLRNTKTDLVDAKLIAVTLSKLNTHIDKSNQMADLYRLCCTRDDLKRKRSTAKIQLVANVDRIFPELASFFSGSFHINTCYRLLEKYPLPSQILKTRIDVLTKLFQKASHGQFKKVKLLSSNLLHVNQSEFLLINLRIKPSCLSIKSSFIQNRYSRLRIISIHMKRLEALSYLPSLALI